MNVDLCSRCIGQAVFYQEQLRQLKQEVSVLATILDRVQVQAGIANEQYQKTILYQQELITENQNLILVQRDYYLDLQRQQREAQLDDIRSAHRAGVEEMRGDKTVVQLTEQLEEIQERMKKKHEEVRMLSGQLGQVRKSLKEELERSQKKDKEIASLKKSLSKQPQEIIKVVPIHRELSKDKQEGAYWLRVAMAVSLVAVILTASCMMKAIQA
ncbi:MAG: hypothetical protein FJZ58_07300 [Chlamydiae bacterium]|nr:hypothetical protein [Chlamydiota bacterium]